MLFRSCATTNIQRLCAAGLGPGPPPSSRTHPNKIIDDVNQFQPTRPMWTVEGAAIGRRPAAPVLPELSPSTLSTRALCLTKWPW